MKRRPKGSGMADRLFLRNMDEDFKDRTNDARIKGRDQYGNYVVTFSPRSEPRRYNPENVAFVSTENVPIEGSVLFAKGKQQHYSLELKQLISQNQAFGIRYEIVSRASSGGTYSKLYLPSELEQKKSASSSSLFRYLQSVAEAIKPDTSDPKKTRIPSSAIQSPPFPRRHARQPYGSS